MTAIGLTVIPHQTQMGAGYQHLRFEILHESGILEPGDLCGLSLPDDIQWDQGIVIEGKGPIWLYGYLVHVCHAAAWVGCFDPRLGAVVVMTHVRSVQVGQVLPIVLPVL
ncbi:MAG: CRISPR-associated ring nuclease Crn3/Csx3 [Oculatellaceae cyanobacterium Prado106]|nr:CRISPR-associated ring nuclease Crn3/Csx3 [Oculatellaceae cyanobacterium Prado106]